MFSWLLVQQAILYLVVKVAHVGVPIIGHFVIHNLSCRILIHLSVENLEPKYHILIELPTTGVVWELDSGRVL